MGLLQEVWMLLKRLRRFVVTEFWGGHGGSYLASSRRGLFAGIALVDCGARAGQSSFVLVVWYGRVVQILGRVQVAGLPVRCCQTPSSSAAWLRRTSLVWRRQPERRAEASKWASIQPRPRPWSFPDSIRWSTSGLEATTADGNRARADRKFLRSLRLPQASSPVTKGWFRT